MAKKDTINHPAHYTAGKIETIDKIEDMVNGYDSVEAYSVGQIVRYLERAPHKGEKEQDLKKAQWYMNRLVGMQ